MKTQLNYSIHSLLITKKLETGYSISNSVHPTQNEFEIHYCSLILQNHCSSLICIPRIDFLGYFPLIVKGFLHSTSKAFDLGFVSEKFELEGYPQLSLSRQNRGERFMRRKNDYGNYVDIDFYFFIQVTFPMAQVSWFSIFRCKYFFLTMA